jgi:hypothetical protein
MGWTRAHSRSTWHLVSARGCDLLAFKAMKPNAARAWAQNSVGMTWSQTFWILGIVIVVWAIGGWLVARTFGFQPSPASRVERLRIDQNESPQGCARWGLFGPWGQGGRGRIRTRTRSNGRSGLVFPGLLVIVRPLRNARRGVAFRYFDLGAVVVGVQRPHGARPAAPAASEHRTDARCRRRTAQTGQRV